MSDRRLATLASLLGLTLLVYAMVAVRVAYSDNLHYAALVWNLFLAWVPFVLALVVYDRYHRGAAPLPLLAGGVVWLLFFPNAPYIVTDLKYLGSWDGAPIWFDVVLASAAAWAGLALGFLSLYLMQAVVRRVLGTLNAWLFVLAVLALGSFGIYLGRFQRWNSWDVFTQPGALLRDLEAGLTSPADQAKALAVTVLFTAFLAATYLVFYSFLSLSSPQAEPSRR
ncbi:MAG TPA: DUF1361 domain-containing protein [Gaiellaceae bacterium]|jgi:uncharacterized membrane protein|nr:DUF1361 domain-containing protein [Gaiellaceae bacterium]